MNEIFRLTHFILLVENNDSMNYIFYITVTLLVITANATPSSELTDSLVKMRQDSKLRGLQLQISKSKEVVYNINLGQKNEANEPIDNNTLFRIASVSKSFSSVAIMQLVEQGKLTLNQSLSSIFGYKIENPFFPGVEITVDMILSHQSSIVECEPYYPSFLSATLNAKDGAQVPNIRQILLQGGKFYNDCLYSKTAPPGSYYEYVNLNFVIAGSIVEILTQVRFDEYQRDKILPYISEGLSEIATFNIANIKNTKNLGVLYQGSNGKWQTTCDNYPSGIINQRNLTGYKIGSNGAIYGPQGGLRASVSHLTNYAIMLANGGTTKSGKVLLSPSSVKEILKPRYQLHGKIGGVVEDFHTYGLGIYTTTYRSSDTVVTHEVVKGHTGAAYNLISAQYFWKDYTMTFIINGAFDGYGPYFSNTIYEQDRITIHKAVEKFVNTQFSKPHHNLEIE